MIVTTGRIIKVETGDAVFRYMFERTSETPGSVRVHAVHQSVTVELPANEADAARFIEAYRRAIKEDVGYRKMENE